MEAESVTHPLPPSLTTADGQFPGEAIWVSVRGPPLSWSEENCRLPVDWQSLLVFACPVILNCKHVCLFTFPARASPAASQPGNAI